MTARMEELVELARATITDVTVRTMVFDEGEGDCSVELRTTFAARVSVPRCMPLSVFQNLLRETYVTMANRARARFKLQLQALGPVSVRTHEGTCTCLYAEACPVCRPSLFNEDPERELHPCHSHDVYGCPLCEQG